MTAGATLASLLSLAALGLVALAPACSSSSNKGGPGGGGNDEGGTSSGGLMLGDGEAAVLCEAGSNLQCQESTCPNGGSTTISGTVFDPAGKNPLYNVAVYVPNATPAALPSGVTCASCSDLYTQPIASAVTDASGSFKILNAPSGQNIPLVVQVGKWRMQYTLATVASCADNPQPSGSLRLPKNHMEGNIPDIAISTGGADSLECLPLRMGIDATEYVPGGSTAGRIHIFQGYMGATTMPAAPRSSAALWSSDTSLEPFDITLFSCEGAPTSGGGPMLTSQNQQYLLDYVNNGGRVFASHFHYAWFTSGPFTSIATPPLMTWTANTLMGQSATIDDQSTFFGAINATTAADGGTFPEGVALDAWLGNVGALTNGELPFFYARDNVISTNTPAQVWLTLDKSKMSANDVMKLSSDSSSAPPQYLSFDLPLNVGVESSKCGRVVYSDLHVSGGPGANEPPLNGGAPVLADYGTGGSAGIAPTGCAMHPLTPQEKALEFMIFDLSSCLIPIGQMSMPPNLPQ
jgi:hypothetical protein